MTPAYLDTLAGRLRAVGVPHDRVAATIDDLTAYLDESGADPETEFGTVDAFAEQLTAGAPADPAPGVETWRWAADVHVDERLLDRFGDQGWEVERVDALGRFVSRRDPDRPQRWEYRREMVAGDLAPLTARLAPDGWEPCGTWIVYAWFKRPRSFTLGPAAELDSPPRPPSRTTFLSRRFYLLIALTAATVIASGIVVAAWTRDPAEGAGFSVGLLAGALVALAPYAAYTAWLNRTR